MKRKMKKRITQILRQQRNIDAMRKDTCRPEGATHFDPEHEVYYKQDGEQWSYFEYVWGNLWKETDVKVDLVEIGGN
ncbi:hypothetical protein [Acinetobacter boissieri]|uniref:Uncharacterized protein n=1 Tax=Acinetobacter boissieri TaxID=1219383 RepID=A0A1G6KCD6_9GAMM|nr:hypothetical protein [Acinetobacter boissieri]SDC28624.1 hypothetical protein SAMN05421733_1167 [Acinetobacter boissieri]